MAAANHFSIPLTGFLVQEAEVGQECIDLISSLPREEGWISSHLYQYQGFWRSSTVIQGILGFQKHFQAHDTDILLVTTPKSGTTWLKAILYATLNRKSFPVDSQKHPLLTSSPHLIVPYMEVQYLQSHEVIPNLDSIPSPRLLFTHMPFVSLPRSVKGSACKIVFLCRNPKDNFVSLWHFTNKVRHKNRERLSLEEAFDKFCRGVSVSGPFWDYVLGYWLESLEIPEKVLFLKYEDVKEQPVETLKKLAEFIGCSFSSEEEDNGAVEDILRLCSFDNLSNLKANQEGELPNGAETIVFFRRGEVGDWVNYLSSEMAEKLDSITEQKLGPHGLKL